MNRIGEMSLNEMIKIPELDTISKQTLLENSRYENRGKLFKMGPSYKLVLPQSVEFKKEELETEQKEIRNQKTALLHSTVLERWFRNNVVADVEIEGETVGSLFDRIERLREIKDILGQIRDLRKEVHEYFQGNKEIIDKEIPHRENVMGDLDD